MRRCTGVPVSLLCAAMIGLTGCGTNPLTAEEMSQRGGKSGQVSSAGASTREDPIQDCLRLNAPEAGASGDLKTRGGPNGEPLPPCGVPNPVTPAAPGVPPGVAPVVPGGPGQAVTEPLPPLTQAPPLSPIGPGACAAQCGCKIGKHGGVKGGLGGGKGGWGAKGGHRGAKKP